LEIVTKQNSSTEMACIYTCILSIFDVVGEWVVQAETNLLAVRKIGPNGAFANSINISGQLVC
jgi:hypothetical protein